MVDAERLLGNLVGGALGNALGGRGTPIFRTAAVGSGAGLGLGLLGVAMAAYEHYQQTAAPTAQAAAAALPAASPAAGPPPTPHASVPPPPPKGNPERGADAIVLIRSMIAAGHADGRIDGEERARIVAAAAVHTGEERAFLDAELATPWSIEQLAAASTPALAADMYAAAAHAIVGDSEVEQAWLDRFALALALDPAARAGIDHRYTA
ncbi:MAG TPA: DUF533 domain-containing protein [Dokdonella sp.]